MANSLERLRNCTTFMLARYPLVLVMPTTHRLAAREAVDVRELKREPFIAYAEPGEKHGRAIIRGAVGFNPEIAYSSGDLLFVSALVEAGFGLAVMPTAMLRDFSGAVSAKPLAGTEVSFGLAAAVRKAGMDSAVTNLASIAMNESGGAATL